MTPRAVHGLEALPRYVAGKHDLVGVAAPIVLSANENPRGPSPKAVAAMQDCAGGVHRYPDGNPEDLKQAIMDCYGLAEYQGAVILGAGSDEIISLLAKGFADAGSTVIMSQYGFLMYPIAAKAAGAEVEAVPEQEYRADVDAILAAVNADTSVIFLANPNNPTGSYLGCDDIMRLYQGLPEHVLLVLDCAYSEYVDQADYSDHHDLVASGRVVVTHTFSKIHGLAGVRLGWAFAPADVADIYERLRSPFNINGLAIQAGIAALQDQDYVRETVRLNAQQRARMQQSLAELEINALPSVGNFLLLDFGSPKAATQAEQALLQAGIIVRGMAGYGLPHCLRLSIGLPEENTAVLEALKDAIV